MLLEINPLALPDIGLLFWNIVAFIVLFFILKSMAWKPILKAIKAREEGIDEALSKAEKVKTEMAQMASENEALLQKAREERAVLIKDAKEQSDKMIADAKDKAKTEYDRIVADAQIAINQQKNAALVDVKNQVGALVIEISEQILKRELSNKAEQENYIKQLAEEIKLN
ncbi:MAG: F0F1 ATP synthase subunit B [Chitinophagaceae bacterium]|nr:F0F1 ATP synthase subunit B [Chitinophagaceae bacterium]MCW5906062.1 F0F1 ATP synthase subunit B [Chitinophagaceae bacterium]